MAREVWAFPVVLALGSTPAAPQVANLALPPRVVTEIAVQVPPGPRGEVGFALGAAGNPIIPQAPGVFIVTDNEVIHWVLESQIDSGAWQLFAYNTGAFIHTLTVRFLVDLPTPPSAAATVFIPAEILGPAAASPLLPVLATAPLGG
jgi:hypothetical protein